MGKILITQKEDTELLCHICGKIFGHMDMLKRHLKGHDETYNCPKCKYTSLRKDAVKRHSEKHKRNECRSLIASNSYQGHPRATCRSRTTLETKAYQSDPSHINSYLYQQTLPKNKEIFPWILHELETQPRRSSYSIKGPIIIPQEADEQLPDPSENTSEESVSTDISSEIDHILNQGFEISTSLSELDLMLRQLESEDVLPPNTEVEETNAWTVLDTLGTIAMDDFK